MASAIKTISWFLLIFLLSSLLHFSLISTTESAEPILAPWPYQFRALLFKNNSGGLQAVDFWYDWSKGGSYGIIQNQLGELTHERAFDNGTSFIYPLGPEKECLLLHIPVGTLRPNWLQGANYRGQQYVDGFLCNVWEKVGLIWYYEDVITKRPVYWSWISYPGFTAHVMTFDVGAVLEDADHEFQVPANCFGMVEDEKKSPILESVSAVMGG